MGWISLGKSSFLMIYQKINFSQFTVSETDYESAFSRLTYLEFFRTVWSEKRTNKRSGWLAPNSRWYHGYDFWYKYWFREKSNQHTYWVDWTWSTFQLLEILLIPETHKPSFTFFRVSWCQFLDEINREMPTVSREKIVTLSIEPVNCIAHELMKPLWIVIWRSKWNNSLQLKPKQCLIYIRRRTR